MDKTYIRSAYDLRSKKAFHKERSSKCNTETIQKRKSQKKII